MTSSSLNPVYTDWGAQGQGFEKLVYSTSVNLPGLSYMDVGDYGYVPGKGTQSAAASGMSISQDEEPCYKFYMLGGNSNSQMIIAPNPDAKGARKSQDCHYQNALIDGVIDNNNGQGWNQYNFPYEKCQSDFTFVNSDGASGAVCALPGTPGLSCLQSCQLVESREEKDTIVNNGGIVIYATPYTPKSTDYVNVNGWWYNRQENNPNHVYDGKYCTGINTNDNNTFSRYWASTLDFRPNPNGSGRVNYISPIIRMGDLVGKRNPVCDPSNTWSKTMSSDYQAAIGSSPKMLDEQNAFKCCATPPDQMVQDPLSIGSGTPYDICGGGQFDMSTSANGSAGCTTLFQKFCTDNWGNPNPDQSTPDGMPLGELCQNFINNSNSTTAINQTIYNYITSNYRCGQLDENGLLIDGTDPTSDGGAMCPQDFVSYSLTTGSDPSNPSNRYYQNHFCANDRNDTTAGYDCQAADRLSPNGYVISHPCCRDDNLDPFFKTGVPKMCMSNNDNRCTQSGILPYFCQQFSRDDIINAGNSAGDTGSGQRQPQTLLNMCGCNLLSSNGPVSAPTSITGTTGNAMNMIGQPQTVSPYSSQVQTAGIRCDPICMNASIQNGPTCTSSVCVIDNVNVNIVNSNASGGISLDQKCSPDSSCYMSNIDINVINSNVSGGTNIIQGCGGGCNKLWPGSSTTENSWPIDCETGCCIYSDNCAHGDFTQNVDYQGNQCPAPTQTSSGTPPATGGGGSGSPSSGTPPAGGGGGSSGSNDDTSTSAGLWSWIKTHKIKFSIILIVIIMVIMFLVSVIGGSKKTVGDSDLDSMGVTASNGGTGKTLSIGGSMYEDDMFESP